MLKNNIADEEMLKDINAQVTQELKEAILFSQNSIEPDVEDLQRYVYAK